MVIPNQSHLKEVAERAAWTFVQAFAGVLVITPLPTSKSAGVALFAAGISAAKTALVKAFRG
jgi:hypothetical protein